MAGLPYFLDAPDQLFAALIFAVLPAWLLLIILPRAALTRVLVQSVIPAFLLGGIYALLVARAADGAMLAAPHPISLTGLMRPPTVFSRAWPIIWSSTCLSEPGKCAMRHGAACRIGRSSPAFF
jgi:hypothetical protein